MYELLKKTFSNAFIYSLGNLSTKLSGFILIPFYTKYLPVDSYGVFGILEVTSAFIISIFGLNLYSALSRWYYDKNYKSLQGSIFYTSTLSLVIFTAVCALILLLLSPDISTLLFDTPDHSFTVQLMIISSIVQIVTVLPTTLMRLQDKPKMFVVTNIVRLLFILLLTIFFLSSLQTGLKGIFMAQLAGNIIYMLIVTPYSIKNFVPVFNTKALKEMLHFSLPLLYASFSALVILMADKYILKTSSGLASTGIYSFGYKIGNTVYYFFVESVNLALSPIVYSLMYEENNKRFFSKIMTYLALIVLFLVIGVSLFSRELIFLLARNPDYYEASNIIAIIAFSALFLTIKDTSVRVLSIAKKTRIISSIIIIISMLNLVLNAILIPIFDIYGASFAYLITYFVYSLLVYWFAQKHYFIPYEVRKIILMAVVAILIIAVSQFFLSEVSALTIFLKILLMGVFPVVLYFFNFYERVELQRIKELFLRKGSK